MNKKALAPLPWLTFNSALVDAVKGIIDADVPYTEPYFSPASPSWCLPNKNKAINDTFGFLINLSRVLQKSLDPDILMPQVSTLSQEKAATILSNSASDDVSKAAAFFFLCQTAFHGVEPKDVKDLEISLDNDGFVAGFANNSSWLKPLLRVQLDERDPLKFINSWDNPGSFSYIDAPLVLGKEQLKYILICREFHHVNLTKRVLALKSNVLMRSIHEESDDLLLKGGFSRVAKDDSFGTLWLSLK